MFASFTYRRRLRCITQSRAGKTVPGQPFTAIRNCPIILGKMGLSGLPLWQHTRRATASLSVSRWRGRPSEAKSFPLDETVGCTPKSFLDSPPNETTASLAGDASASLHDCSVSRVLVRACGKFLWSMASTTKF